jgi:uncharacterized protein
MRALIILLSLFLLPGCHQLVNRVVEEAFQKEKRTTDSQNWKDKPIAQKNDILERKKSGEDSLYLVRCYLLTGEKFSDGWYKNDVRNGATMCFYKNGQVSHVFTFSNDTLMGMKHCYTPDGTPRPEKMAENGNGRIMIYHPITYNLVYDYEIKNGMKNGSYKQWYENGNKQQECTFENDSAVGPYCVWYKSGGIEIERKVDKTTGSLYVSEYYPSGEAKSHETQNSGPAKEYDQNGNLISEKTMEEGKVKEVKYFYDSKNHLMSKGHYLDGRKEGTYEYYYENGEPKALETYTNDQMLTEKRWFENGHLNMEANYENGMLEGILKKYFDNGQLMLEQEYVKDKKHGKYTSYYSNGNLCNEGFYMNDEPKGDMKYYRQDGSFDHVKNFP